MPIWYHTLELAEGVETPGYFDMRPFVPEFGFPASLAGMRVIDVGASNGQFAFHFENLGADLVVALDLQHVLDHDFPAWYREELRARHTAAELERIDWEELEAGFALAHEVYASRVEKRRCTVYELGDRMPGEFDLAYCCNLLQHLSDPVRALESIRRCLKPSGRFVFGCSCDLSVENVSYGIFHGAIDPHITYWAPSREAAERMCGVLRDAASADRPRRATGLGEPQRASEHDGAGSQHHCDRGRRQPHPCRDRRAAPRPARTLRRARVGRTDRRLRDRCALAATVPSNSRRTRGVAASREAAAHHHLGGGWQLRLCAAAGHLTLWDGDHVPRA